MPSIWEIAEKGLERRMEERQVLPAGQVVRAEARRPRPEPAASGPPARTPLGTEPSFSTTDARHLPIHRSSLPVTMTTPRIGLERDMGAPPSQDVCPGARIGAGLCKHACVQRRVPTCSPRHRRPIHPSCGLFVFSWQPDIRVAHRCDCGEAGRSQVKTKVAYLNTLRQHRPDLALP